MSARQPVNYFTHGASGYRNYGCRCNRCSGDHTTYHLQLREKRAAKLAANPSLRSHGDVSTYFNYKCRCDPCRAARTSYGRQRRAAS